MINEDIDGSSKTIQGIFVSLSAVKKALWANLSERWVALWTIQGIDGSRLLLFLSPIYPRGGCSSPCSSLSGLIAMGSSKRVSCDKITSGLQKGFCVLSRDHSG